MHYRRKFIFLSLKERRQTYFLLFSGILIGAAIGLVGSIFNLSIVYAKQLRVEFTNLFSNSNIFLQWSIPILFTLISLVAAVFIVRRFAPETAGSGIQEIEGALCNVRKLKWYRIIPVKYIGGVLTLISGMITGREGPTIHMGGAIGAMLSDKLRLKPFFAHTLIAAGAGAGLSAAFGAPMAGILFVIEEMRPHFRYNFASMQCVIAASVASDIVTKLIMGNGHEIPMQLLASPPITSLWLFVIFGAFFGIIGIFFNKFLVQLMDYFGNLKSRTYWMNIIILGIIIGIMYKICPPFIGSGHELILNALNNQIPVIFLFLLFIARLGGTWICYGSGIPGGIFAPMLSLGTVFGMLFGHYTQILLPNIITDPSIFAIAGMSALFTATVRAPLTGIVLVAELTMNYQIILPLILTCFTATIVANLLGGKPIYETMLFRTLRLEGSN
ncbi:MAG: H(+)/Cl(-) exchange transporter ClcA [bacterium]|nr:H(+)/Cl(-) exchange transporter ClcA [bacterium]